MAALSYTDTRPICANCIQLLRLLDVASRCFAWCFDAFSIFFHVGVSGTLSGKEKRSRTKVAAENLTVRAAFSIFQPEKLQEKSELPGRDVKWLRPRMPGKAVENSADGKLLRSGLDISARLIQESFATVPLRTPVRVLLVDVT